MTITLTLQGLTSEVAMRVLRALDNAAALVVVTPDSPPNGSNVGVVPTSPGSPGEGMGVASLPGPLAGPPAGPTGGEVPRSGPPQPAAVVAGEPAKPASVGAAPTPGNGGSEGLVAALADAAKLRDVVVYLHEKHGCKSARDVLALCTSLRERVPVLARITNLDERVLRTAELLGIE